MCETIYDKTTPVVKRGSAETEHSADEALLWLNFGLWAGQLSE